FPAARSGSSAGPGRNVRRSRRKAPPPLSVPRSGQSVWQFLLLLPTDGLLPGYCGTDTAASDVLLIAVSSAPAAILYRKKAARPCQCDSGRAALSLWRSVPVSPDPPAEGNEVVSAIQAGGFSAGYLKENSSAGTGPAVLRFYFSAGSPAHAPQTAFSLAVVLPAGWQAYLPPVSSFGSTPKNTPLQSSVSVSIPDPALPDGS